MRKLVVFMAVVGTSTALAVPVYTIADRNSEVGFDLGGPGSNSWRVDGVQNLTQQWFWVREGAAPQETPLYSLPLIASAVTDTNFFIDPREDTLSARYGDLSGLTYDVSFRIQGGLAGSRRADLSETIVITNHSTTARTLSFYQYSDFRIGNTPANDTSQFLTPNVFRTWDAWGVFNETVVSPSPNGREVSMVPTLLNSLNDGGITTLSGAMGPVFGNVAWGFSWNLTIPAFGSRTIGKDKNFIPEPTTGLLLLAGAALLRRR